jgi:hypothetical protein
MKVLRLLLAAVAAALGVWAWVALHPGPEKAIRRQLAEVARAASFGRGQGYMAQLSAAQRLADCFSTNVEIALDVPGHQEHRLAGRADIQQAILSARASLQGLSVSFPDVTVIVAGDGQSAVADLTLEARIAGQQDMIVQEMKFTLRKIAGQWLIVKVETVRTLSRNHCADHLLTAAPVLCPNLNLNPNLNRIHFRLAVARRTRLGLRLRLGLRI